MKSSILLTCAFLALLLIMGSVISASVKSEFQFPFSKQANAQSENELEFNCSDNDNDNEDLCILEACLGNECSAIGKGLGPSQMLSGKTLLGNDQVRLGGKDNCGTSDKKQEINNFNFRASTEEPDELASTNLLEESGQTPLAKWGHSGSDILIGMDLGVMKRICNIDIGINDEAEIKNGFVVTVSNGSKGPLEVVDKSATGSLTNSWSSHNFDNLVGRFIHLTIPGVSEYYVDSDDEDPIVSEIKVKANPLTPPSSNSIAKNNTSGNTTRQETQAANAQLELSPLEFLDSGSDLLNIPVYNHEHHKTNQSSMADMPTLNMYTGDIFIP